MELDDIELLRAYVREGNESAFRRLVERHGPWVSAAARRRLGDDHLCDDATQAVFLVLASKASELVGSKHGSLSAWLFHVTHFTCARLRRTQHRQQALEKAAGMARARDCEGESAEAELLVLMEDSISQLTALERETIVRRFYRRQDFGEIGAAVGMSAEAARKRVSRSLVEIKKLMLRNGIDVIPATFLTNFNTAAKSRRAQRTAIDGKRINSILKETSAMATQEAPISRGHQMISAEFLVRSVEENLAFFEKLGFPRRFIDATDASGKVPRASLTAGQMGKIWIRRATEAEIHPSPSINVFFWINGGPEGLIAHRTKLARDGIAVTPIIDEHGLPNFNVTTPDGYSIAFFTQYVPPGKSPVVLVK